MSEEEFKLLFNSLGGLSEDDKFRNNEVLKNLMRDTLKFRDKLKEDTGEILTIEDTHKALSALETHLNGEKFPKDITPIQKALAQILIDRVILFKIQ